MHFKIVHFTSFFHSHSRIDDMARALSYHMHIRDFYTLTFLVGWCWNSFALLWHNVSLLLFSFYLQYSILHDSIYFSATAVVRGVCTTKKAHTVFKCLCIEIICKCWAKENWTVFFRSSFFRFRLLTHFALAILEWYNSDETYGVRYSDVKLMHSE